MSINRYTHSMRHMQVCIWMLLLSALPYAAFSQNIVPNSGFEDYNNCPTGISAIDFSPTYSSFSFIKDWVNPLKYTSPDYCNVCAAPSSGVHVPEVAFGYQKPKTGNGFAGLILWEESTKPGSAYSFGEYLETKLTSPMIAGREYCVSFYVSPSISSSLSFNYMAMDEIGIHFSNTQVSQATGSSLLLSYDMRNPVGKYISDTSGWVKVNGIYKATGGEEWLTLGRFTTGTPAHVLSYPTTPNPSYAYRTYVYIDDINVSIINKGDTLYTTHDSTYCNSSSLPMHLLTTTMDGNFTWSNGAITPDITATEDGIYWCKNVSDCRVYIDTFIVRMDPANKLDLGKELVDCNNGPVTIKANHKYDKYKWNTGDTTDSIIVSSPGTFWLKTTNFCGVQTDTVRVYIQPPTAQPVVHDTMICQLVPEPILKDIIGKNLLWYTNPTSSVGSPIQPYIYTGDVTQYIYYVTQTVGKCESKKSTIKIDVKYQPRHQLEDKISMCRHSPLLIGNEYPGVKYYWSTTERSCCIRPQHEGFFTLTTSNECGTYTDTTTIIFNPCEECIAVPNAFTPDGDGVNDKFVVFQTCPIADYHMYIFDRWGGQVFETRDIRHAWTGTIEGRYVEAGVYVYVIEYKPDATEFKKVLKGTIHLIR